MRFILLILVALAFPSAAQDDLTAKAWLENMSQALRTSQFKMTLIQLQADNIRPLIFLHGNIDDKDIAFVEHLNGPMKNAVKVGNVVTFIEHEQPPYSIHASHIQGILPAAFSAEISKLQLGYKLVLGGRSRIAGRSGQMIRILPNDSYRYSFQVWVDMKTFLPLRYDMLTEDRQLLEQLMVIEIDELEEPAPLLVEAYKQDWPVVMDASERQDGQNWTFEWLPVGFQVVVRDHHRLIGSHEPVEYIALTDGLSQISVYVARATDAPIPAELITRNGLSMASAKVGDLEVVAIGKVPTKTLSRIAASITLE